MDDGPALLARGEVGALVVAVALDGRPRPVLGGILSLFTDVVAR